MTQTSSYTAPQELSKCPRSPSSTETPESSRAKICRIHENKGRPKASDFDDTSENIINLVKGHYRALIATQEPFPDTSKELELIRLAWAYATTTAGYEPNKAPAISPDVASIVRFNLLVSLSC